MSENNYITLSNLKENKSVTKHVENTEVSKLNKNTSANMHAKENKIQQSRASPTLKEKYNSLLNTLKISNNKAIKIAVLVIILCVMIVLYFNITAMDNHQGNDKKINYTYTTSLEYAKSLEDKLEGILSKIKGAKDAKVMVRLEGSLELILAEKTDEKNNSTTNGTSTNSYVTTVTEPIILTNGNVSTPLVLTEKLPEVKGVVVVCKGANDVMVKMDIISAVKTLFEIPYGQIEVFAGD